MGMWPPGVPIYRVTPRCFDIYFEEMVSPFVLNVTFLYFVSLKGPKWPKTTIKKLGVWPPGVTIRGVTPWGVHNFFSCFQPYFKNNLGLGWFFMFKFTKMAKKRQNMVKTWKFKFFRHFGTPQGGDGEPKKKIKIFLCSFRCLLTERFMKCHDSMNLALPAYHLGKKTWNS